MAKIRHQKNKSVQVCCAAVELEVPTRGAKMYKDLELW